MRKVIYGMSVSLDGFIEAAAPAAYKGEIGMNFRFGPDSFALVVKSAEVIRT